MTVIRHNSISGIVSITAAAGSNLAFYDSTGSTLSLDTGDINAGVITATTANFTNATISGDLTVNGTTTTLDTTVTEVDRLEVGANNSTVGVAITQSGSGDILRLYDGATEVFSVTDGGDIISGINGFFYDYSTGKLGVGLDTPGSTRLHVKGHSSLNNSLLIDVNTGDTTLGFAQNGTEKWRIENVTSADALRFYDVTNTAERLRITSTGNVGIGTDNPTQKLDVNGSVTANDSYRLEDSDTSAVIQILSDISGNYTGWKERNVASGSMSQASIDSKTPTINDFTYPSSSNGMLIWSTSKIGFAVGSASPQYGTGVQMLYDTNGLALSGYRAFDRTSSVSSSTANIKLFSQTGNVELAGNIQFASGKGIDFSAASGSSAGSTSALLDDYEEGTWTPALSFGGTACTMNTSGNQKGTYVRIGGIVCCSFNMQTSSKNSGSGNATMSGFPFSSTGVSNLPFYNGNIQPDSGMSLPTGAGSVMIYLGSGSTNARLLYMTYDVHSDLNATMVSDSQVYYGYITYRVG